MNKKNKFLINWRNIHKRKTTKLADWLQLPLLVVCNCLEILIDMCLSEIHITFYCPPPSLPHAVYLPLNSWSIVHCCNSRRSNLWMTQCNKEHRLLLHTKVMLPFAFFFQPLLLPLLPPQSIIPLVQALFVNVRTIFGLTIIQIGSISGKPVQLTDVSCIWCDTGDVTDMDKEWRQNMKSKIKKEMQDILMRKVARSEQKRRQCHK